MAWNDAPPTPSELGTDKQQWDAAPPTKEELEGRSVSGFVSNLGSDIANTAKGVAALGKGLVLHPVDTVTNTATHLPEAIINEGKRLGAGELLTGHPLNAASKFGEALYDKPLTTGLDVLPAVGAAGKVLGFGGEAASALDMAADAGRLAETPAAGEAALGASKSVPLGSTFQETVGNLTPKIPEGLKTPINEVNDFVAQKFGQAKPKFADIASDYLKEHGQNMTLKELGAAPGQVRKIGVDRAHALADYAMDNGLAGPDIGTIGREKLVPQRLEEAGGAVGGFRKMAADRGAVHNVDELIDQIRSKLDDKYLTPEAEFNGPNGEIIKSGGIHSGEGGKYFQALSEIKRSGGGADQMADTISKLFREAKNADRLKQPSGPLSDVARQLREINHNTISKHLSPEEQALYEKSLEDYGALTQIHEFVKRRGAADAGGRLGPGSGISRAAVQKFLDSVGYRTEAKIARKLSDFIRQNPEVVQRPRDMFRHYIDEAAEAVDEMGNAAQ